MSSLARYQAPWRKRLLLLVDVIIDSIDYSSRKISCARFSHHSFAQVSKKENGRSLSRGENLVCEIFPLVVYSQLSLSRSTISCSAMKSSSSLASSIMRLKYDLRFSASPLILSRIRSALSLVLSEALALSATL